MYQNPIRIKEGDVEKHIGLDIIAVFDNGFIEFLTRDGQQYILDDMSEDSLSRLLPWLYRNNDADNDGDEVDCDEAYFGNAEKYCDGWYCVDLKFASMAPHMVLFYTPEMVNLFKRYSNRFFATVNNDPESVLGQIADLIKKDTIERGKRQKVEERLFNLRKMLDSAKTGILISDVSMENKILTKEYPGCLIIDVSSNSTDEMYKKFSIDYCHEGGVPVPGKDVIARSIGSFVRKSSIYELSCDKKNTVKRIVGCRIDNEMLSLSQARESYFIPMYKWVLENKVHDLCKKLRQISQSRVVILLDDSCNHDIDKVSERLSYAFVAKEYIDGLSPEPASKMKSRVTPERIEHLEKGQVFVFGSDVKGNHIRGAAKMACDRFGAMIGKGNGFSGSSYAIPTMRGNLQEVKKYVDEFLDFAKRHGDLTFLTTKIGCGVAGYSVSQIAPLFKAATELENVWLPQDFWDYLKL